MNKFPEDLRVYEELLWDSRANVVIELGTQFGGSALWFRDRLRSFTAYGRIKRPLVISVDRESARAREAVAAVDRSFSSIVLLEGDVRDPALPDLVARHIPKRATCFVVDDSAHTYETTSAALHGFARFVGPGGYFVVEDGCVDVEELRVDPTWPRGVIPAIVDFLGDEAGNGFVVRRDLERYGLTCHVNGFLQRVA